MNEQAFPHYFDTAFDIVTIAASLGGLKALTRVLSSTPAGFPCPIVVVQHIPANPSSRLAQILGSQTSLQVKEGEQGESLKPGTVYVAPPDRHLVVTGSRTVSLLDAPKRHFVRPAADVLFESAAKHYGNRALALVLTGRGTDGATGARAIKDCGGRVIVQDAATSQAFGMPSATIETGSVDFTLPLDKIAAAMTALVMVRGAATLFRVTASLPDRSAYVRTAVPH